MTPLSRDDLEALSAYLDGALSAKERAALESRLTAEPELRSALNELRRTMTILRAAPRLTVPRNYTLDPARYARRAPWWTRLDVFRTVGMLGAAASTALILIGVLLGNFGALPASAPLNGASNEVAMPASQTAAPARDAVGQSAVAAAPTVVVTPSPMPTATPAATHTATAAGVQVFAQPSPAPSLAPFGTLAPSPVGEDGQAASRQADSAAGGMVAPGALPPSPAEPLARPTETMQANFPAQTLVGEAEAPTAPEAGAALMGEGSPGLAAQATPVALSTGLPTQMLVLATTERQERTAPAATTAKAAPPSVQMSDALEESVTASATASPTLSATSAVLAALPTQAPAPVQPQEARALVADNPLPRLLIVVGLGLLVVSAVTWLIGRARRGRS